MRRGGGKSPHPRKFNRSDNTVSIHSGPWKKNMYTIVWQGLYTCMCLCSVLLDDEVTPQHTAWRTQQHSTDCSLEGVSRNHIWPVSLREGSFSHTGSEDWVVLYEPHEGFTPVICAIAAVLQGIKISNEISSSSSKLKNKQNVLSKQI